MFNLEASIAQWRQQMQRAGIRSKATLEELESHLRDDIDQQLNNGVSIERAFETAASKIGSPASLNREFVKSGGLRDAIKGRETAALHLIVVGFYELLATLSLTQEYLTHSARLIQIAALALAVVLSYVCWRVTQRFLPRVPNRRQLTVWGLAATGLGLGWCLTALAFFMPWHNPVLGILQGTIWVAIIPGLVLSMTAFLAVEKYEQPEELSLAK